MSGQTLTSRESLELFNVEEAGIKRLGEIIAVTIVNQREENERGTGSDFVSSGRQRRIAEWTEILGDMWEMHTTVEDILESM